MSETTPETDTEAGIDPTTEDTRAILTQLCERIATLEAEVEARDDRIDSLESRVADLEARGEAATRKRNHLEAEIERVENETKTEAATTEETTTEDAPEKEDAHPTTPLEQVVGLPESLADQELSANQQRARFIAQDVRDYAEKVPAGYAIPSGDIRKVLSAKEGSTPHTQTVARVMDFLDELGGEGVTLVERRGTKRIAFSEEAVARLEAHADRRPEAGAGDDVDAEGGGSITPVVMGGR